MESFEIIGRLFEFRDVVFYYEAIGITIREFYWLLALLMVVVVSDIMRNKTDMIVWISNRNFIIRWTLYTLLIVVVIVFGVYGPGYNAADFIYSAF